MSTAALIVLVVFAHVAAWRLLRAFPVAVLGAVAVAGWLGHGTLPVPEPVEEAVSAAEAWREDRIAALRCRAAVLAALSSADDPQALERVEVACRDRGRPARATV
jgi:hypothetical protein